MTTKIQQFQELKNGKIEFHDGLCFCDWLEFSVSGDLNFDYINALQIAQNLSNKTSQVYKNIMEFENFTLMWGFYGKAKTSERVHIKIANSYLYQMQFLSPWQYFNSVKHLFKSFNIENSYISRIDLAFDVVKGTLNYDKILFNIKHNTFQNAINGEKKGVVKFTEHYDGKNYYNYTLGSRSSDVFIRFYNKTYENVDRLTGCIKKDYIDYYHNILLGQSDIKGDVYRLEFEVKYNNMPITMQTFESITKCLINEQLRECDTNEALTIKTKRVSPDCLSDKFFYELLNKLTKYTKKYPVSEDLTVAGLMKFLKHKVIGKVD